MASDPPRVVLADHDVYARNLLRIVCTDHVILVVGEADTTRELVALCNEEQPDVALTSVTLADGPIDGCVDAILNSGTRIVVMSDDPSPERLTVLLARGVSGYLLPDSAPAQVADAVHSVALGAAALHPTAAITIVEQWRALRRNGEGAHLAPRATLTAREHDVLTAMAQGMATKAIARHLGVAVKTVENHKIRIFDKLGVRTHAHAVSLAIGQGLLAHSGADA